MDIDTLVREEASQNASPREEHRVTVDPLMDGAIAWGTDPGDYYAEHDYSFDVFG